MVKTNTLLSLLILMLSVFSSSCGVMQIIVVDTTASLLADASHEIETEANLKMFKKGLPANLKQMEGLLFLSPENERMLISLTKGYAAYAFVVSETEMMKNHLAGEEENPAVKKQLLLNYSKALNYGMRFLNLNGIAYGDLQREMGNTNGIISLLDKKLDDEGMHYEGVLFTAQALGSLIFAQKDKVEMLSQLPIVKSLFDWVCAKEPNINFGACDIFYGIYEAGRPRMMGGNPEKGKRIFLSLIKRMPANWLARTSYVRFYLIPMMDEDGYKDQKFYLEKMAKLLARNSIWKTDTSTPAEMKNKGLRLYQALAIKRFNIIKKNEEELF